MLSLLQDIKIAEYNLKSTTSGLKTHVNLNLTLPEYTETIRQFEDTSVSSFIRCDNSITTDLCV